ncbi:MAG: DNA mismatch repair endonuclease MutL, partial [Chloroflexi bacterium]|nr:DNA mismatch repair endonuclease MutL [Chloroflexota bacterium]
LLDPQVVARIAAGEVVERPASVVKELVENALDAGASQIAVEAMGGGISLLRVTDNGSGIPGGEVELAFQRHATSKISDIHDLESIATLGFRGEALASVAAVADVEIATCAAGESAGSYLSLRDGAVIGRNSQGRSQGTTVTVRNLFRSIPARLKFLKSTGTENNHIASVVSQYALAFPEVRFNLSLDGRTALRTPGTGRLIDSVIEVYGAETARNMVEVGRNEAEWSANGSQTAQVSGLVGMPTISRSNRNYLSFFVNRRWVNSRLLSWAVEEAYHGLLMTGKHPVAVLNIGIPGTEIDVNIHPAKTEIKFRDEHGVFAAVQRTVRRALIEPVSLPKAEEPVAIYAAPSSTCPAPAMPVPGVHHTPTTPLSAMPAPSFSLPALRLLGQVASCYIVAEGPDGLYLIDQHAAHERVLFEQVSARRAGMPVAAQGLLEPAAFDVTPGQNEVLKSRYTALAEFGFSLEPFGERAYLVRTVPACLHEKDWMAVLRELTDSAGGDWTERLAISIACHSAVRAGQTMSDSEMRELIRQLERAAMPHTCPHGRPTMLHITRAYLEREFGRRG